MTAAEQKPRPLASATRYSSGPAPWGVWLHACIQNDEFSRDSAVVSIVFGVTSIVVWPLLLKAMARHYSSAYRKWRRQHQASVERLLQADDDEASLPAEMTLGQAFAVMYRKFFRSKRRTRGATAV